MAILNIKNLPDGLYRKLKTRAKAQNRSVAQEVTRILQDAIERSDASPTTRREARDTVGHMIGRASRRLSTDEILALTRGKAR